ncbi:AAA family ATPase [Prevotella ihumii]|uniref:AAA family ATPase n=1 Tax=Prevotella ihumii TaxID=1917878 RepID=UPI0009FC1BA5|nr:AAA family ATPase [Prevotella ihumii]
MSNKKNNITWFQDTLERVGAIAEHLRHEYILPEHFLFVIFHHRPFFDAFNKCGGEWVDAMRQLIRYFDTLDKIDEVSEKIVLSAQTRKMIDLASKMGTSNINDEPYMSTLVAAMYELQDSYAGYVLTWHIGDIVEFLNELERNYRSKANNKPTFDEDGNVTNIFDFVNPQSEMNEYEEAFEDFSAIAKSDDWKELVTDIMAQVSTHNPLIGREAELDRTIQVLCRKDKNNPLHVGEPGVGKTSLVYGLAQRILNGNVPERLRACYIYQMDMGQMLAGTQYRGDFEKRMKQVLDGAKEEGNCIIYLDELHNIMGAGANGQGGPDAANILKPYLESGEIKFIGSTTYEEYNKKIAQSKSIVRRFQQIDILEPSVDEAIEILRGLQTKYEHFHHVVYRKEVIEYAVKASHKYIADRFLPDKAIDLIDEAGAYLETHPNNRTTQYVTKGLVEEILQRVCKVNAMALKEDGNETLKTLYTRITEKIYGQDEAVRNVVESVQMAKAGLLDDNKPLASLLFVGPTGVGKTEVARVLSDELGIELVRFDMSEFAEKHAVAKLIGSPAGYVGYEDGGLLTDAIRKSPNCVLLLDEVEKAHTDIYDILLQVMDYARLTDNKGNKADFRNVVLIMTSNAGAQYAAQANVGFAGNVSRGEAMMKQVKRTFKPEFLNRLSSTVVFHDMDKPMAELILKKKLKVLEQKLDIKRVKLTISDAAFAYLLDAGFTKEYGAREMDRVINSKLKPLLMREILFGKLAKGGIAMVEIAENALTLSTKK